MERLTRRNTDGSVGISEFRYYNYQDFQKLARKLADYEDLEEKGLLPKFHLGDEFWTVRLREVLKSEIVMLQQKKDGTWRYRFRQEISPKYHDTSDYEESDYGKYFFTNNYFFTRVTCKRYSHCVSYPFKK